MKFKRAIYLSVGCLGCVLGAVGAVLPLLPSFPFLMLAAVRAMAPVAGIPPNRAEALFPTPWATSSILELCREPIISICIKRIWKAMFRGVG